MARRPSEGAPARYLGSYLEQLPPPALPEVAFAGRSNVGKSSTLNTLCGVEGLARVSKTPGRTQALNFFEVGGTWLAVDLPGYGHAQVSRDTRANWKRWIEGYLFGRETLRLVIALVDSRIPAQASDKALLTSLVARRVPTLVVATKIDAVTRGKRDGTLSKLAVDLGIQRDQLLGFSAHESIGLDDLRAMIGKAVGERMPR